MSNPTAWKEFYQKLGYLFYGIASAESPMNADKLELLKKNVHDFWGKNKHQLVNFHADTENNVDTMFDWLNLNENPWEDCVREFKYFANTFGPEMPAEMKTFVLESANRLAFVFGTANNPALKATVEIMGEPVS